MNGDSILKSDLPSFTRRAWKVTLIVTAVLGGILLLWLAAKVFLLFFAGALLAIFLRTIADFIGRHAHLSRGWSLALTIVLLLAIAPGAGWLLATPVSNQVRKLSGEIPQAVNHLEARLSQYSWGQTILNRIQDPGGILAQNGGMMNKVKTIFSISVEGIIDLWVILFCGVYLAARPEFYLDGFVRLVPVARRDRAKDVLLQIGGELRHWLFGQIVSMSIIGFLTWLGLFLLGISASELLGILAGVLDFVPVAGPWVAGIISSVIALLKGPMSALFVVCLFITLHFLEGHLVIPLVQKKATRLPPVLTILAMVLFYGLFGFLGLLLAVPLLAVVIVATRTLYVEDVIERRRREDPIAIAAQ